MDVSRGDSVEMADGELVADLTLARIDPELGGAGAIRVARAWALGGTSHGDRDWPACCGFRARGGVKVAMAIGADASATTVRIGQMDMVRLLSCLRR